MTRRARWSRRALAARVLPGLALAALIESLVRAEALAAEPAPATTDVLAQLDALCRAARRGAIDGLDWQRQLEALLAKVDVAALLAAIRFDALASGMSLEAGGRAERRLAGETMAAAPVDAAFDGKLFGFGARRAIVPHGHDSTLSAFLVLRGEFHVRHYERLHDAPDGYVIRPTIDRVLGPGACTTISDLRDNIHWFTARSEGAYLLNVRLAAGASARDPRRPPRRVYLDPEGAALPDGRILAPRSSRQALLEKYDG